MEKIWLIIQREYLTRVKKRAFLITTLLTPLGLAAFIAVSALIMGYQSDQEQKIVIQDQSSIISTGIKDENNLKFSVSSNSLDELKDEVRSGKYDGIIQLNQPKNLYEKKTEFYYYSDKELNIEVRQAIKSKISKIIRDYRAVQLGMDQKSLDALSFKISIDPEPIDNTESNDSSMTSTIGAMLGMGMGFIMYMVIVIYGMMVMRSVQEEKTTRIVEVMISSVKPFQLMLGKVVGVGLVGVTQFLIWAILIPLVIFITTTFFGIDTSASIDTSSTPEIDPETMEYMVQTFMVELQNINWWMIVPVFLLYFISGYLIYASLFAAVGSAVGDDMGENQSLTLPITLPVSLAIYIAMVAVRNPDSPLAFWSSLFPLFSPVVMPARLAFDIPFWQVALSLIILISTALLLIWLSGRIYRTGILLYGKKITFKDLGKWLLRG